MCVCVVNLQRRESKNSSVVSTGIEDCLLILHLRSGVTADPRPQARPLWQARPGWTAVSAPPARQRRQLLRTKATSDLRRWKAEKEASETALQAMRESAARNSGFHRCLFTHPTI